MLMSVFTVYDSKIAAYLPPFFMQTPGAAIRAISDCMMDKNHQFAAHPEDYTLFYLGTFDNENAQYAMEETPKSLAVLIELINTGAIS